MTEWCWGFGWGDEVIDMKTRSMMNSINDRSFRQNDMSGKYIVEELIINGVSKEEIRAIIHVIGIYCGVPQAIGVLSELLKKF